MKMLNIIGTAALAVVLASPALAQEAPDAGGGAPARASTVVKNLGLTQDAWNAPLRARGLSRTRPGYVRYVYNPEDVFPIRTRESMITTIKLPEAEKLTQAFSGDDAGFQVGIPSPNTIAVKALYPGVDTNLVAYTEDGKVYTFYMRSEGYNSKVISDFLVDVVQPGRGIVEAGVEGTPAAAVSAGRMEKTDVALAQRVRDPYSSTPNGTGASRDYADDTDFDPRTVVEDMSVYVPEKSLPGVMPYKVFRDDRFTYIDYGANASQMTEWPTVTLVVQGVETPVGFRTAGPGGRMIVVEAIGELVLRNGQRILCIKRKGSVGPKDKLVQYPTAHEQGMRIATDLPPGRPGPRTTRPVTVVPASAVPKGVKTISTVRRVGPGTPPPSVVVDTPIETVAAVPRAATSPVRESKSGKVFVPAMDQIAPARPAPARVSEAPAATPVAPEATKAGNTAALSGYALDLGTGDEAALSDRWKSYKVQYYGQLNGKRVEYRDVDGKTKSMRVLPVATASEGMALCGTIATDGAPCAVVPNR